MNSDAYDRALNDNSPRQAKLCGLLCGRICQSVSVAFVVPIYTPASK